MSVLNQRIGSMQVYGMMAHGKGRLPLQVYGNALGKGDYPELRISRYSQGCLGYRIPARVAQRIASMTLGSLRAHCQRLRISCLVPGSGLHTHDA